MVGLGGCGLGFGAVEVDAFEAMSGSQTACENLISSLPEVVSDAVRRDVSPDGAQAAAWGQPAVVLRCGVGLPPQYQPDDILTVIDGVAWLPVDGMGGQFFATVDRNPIVEVAVPDAYSPPDVLGDLAESVAAQVPLRGPE